MGVTRDITERKQAEDMIRESEERYRTLFNNAQDGIALADAETSLLVDCNQVLCRMVERNKQELVGQAQNILHPSQDLISGLSPTFLKHQIDNPGQALEDRLMTRGGRFIPVEIRAAKIRLNNRNFLLGIFRDITDRKRAEEKLRESEKQYRLLADNIQDVVFLMDMNLNYIYISPSVKLLRGYEPEEAMKHTPAETLTPSSLDLAMGILSEILEMEKSEQRELNISRTAEFEMTRKDGTTVWVEIKASIVRDENKQAVGIMGVTRDITERRWRRSNFNKCLKTSRKQLARLYRSRCPP